MIISDIYAAVLRIIDEVEERLHDSPPISISVSLFLEDNELEELEVSERSKSIDTLINRIGVLQNKVFAMQVRIENTRKNYILKRKFEDPHLQSRFSKYLLELPPEKFKRLFADPDALFEAFVGSAL